jgi:hypothetical protein
LKASLKALRNFAPITVLAITAATVLLIVTGGVGASSGFMLKSGESMNLGCSTGHLVWQQTGWRTGEVACSKQDTPPTSTPPTTTPPTTTPPTTTPPTTVPSAGSSGCVFASSPGAVPAFCDSFGEGPSTNGANSRDGALDDTLWGVSRWTGNENFGNSADDWASAQLSTCGSSDLVNPPDDVQICNGQLVDTVNDGGTVTSLAMYPKQPFNFANRTGTIVFDVNDNSEGSHSAWPELWMSDQPVPDPFTHEGGPNLPRNGFGIRFAGCYDPSNTCVGGPPDTVTVDSAVTVNNYVANDSFLGGSLRVDDTGAVTESGPGQMNHFEVQVSQNQIDVYGTNAFSGPLNLSNTPLVHIATIPNVNLNFSQGLVYLEDVHYNGDKFNNERVHTFTWSNFGFDGPVMPRDLAFDVPDNNVPDDSTQAGPSVAATDLGYYIPSGTSKTFTVPGVTGVSAASDGLLTFDIFEETQPTTMALAVNGNPITFTVPSGTDTFAVPVPLSDVVTGDNTVTFGPNADSMNVMNIDLIMQGAGGAGGVVQP